ncbi:MAG: tRNA (adenosine(37)-N6)-dimethylallyltransferase MiaA [Anaerolineaceae bacterium]|jgi:tRNA dimethylallyltransferase
MPFINAPDPVVVIVGPTAVGKTEISVQLAERLGGEIVSCDSRLFYRGMDIGTAKPTLEEQARVRHHLIDVADPDEVWSLALFQRAAREVIRDVHYRRKLPLLVGGTGQYVRAVIQGWDLPEQQPVPGLRNALEKWGNEIGAEKLHARLSVLDPAAAELIQYQNVRRTVRALEVILRTGRRFSAQRQRLRPVYSLLLIGLTRPRPELYARIDARIDKMVEQGLADEVQNLLTKGYSPTLPAMSAIGYRQMVQYLRGEISLEEVKAQMKRLTRQFVRRQANWFKQNDPEMHWFEVNDRTVDDIERLLQSNGAWMSAS